MPYEIGAASLRMGGSPLHQTLDERHQRWLNSAHAARVSASSRRRSLWIVFHATGSANCTKPGFDAPPELRTSLIRGKLHHCLRAPTAAPRRNRHSCADDGTGIVSSNSSPIICVFEGADGTDTFKSILKDLGHGPAVTTVTGGSSYVDTRIISLPVE